MVIENEEYKEVLMIQLEKLKMLIDGEDDIMNLMEDKPFVCGNQTMIKPGRSLRVHIKVSYNDYDD